MYRRVKRDLKIDCQHCCVRNASVFCNMGPSELQIFNANKVLLSYGPGELIFKENLAPTGLFVVFTGKVKIFKSTPDGKEKIVRLGQEGALLGYRSFLSEELYSATATAIDEVVLCYLPKQALISLISHNPDIAFRLMKVLAKDLREAEHSNANAFQRSARERLADALLRLQQIFGVEAPQQKIKVRLSREEIASLAGLSRETATRVLSEFNKEGFVRIFGKEIAIVDSAKLHRIARSEFPPNV